MSHTMEITRCVAAPNGDYAEVTAIETLPANPYTRLVKFNGATMTAETRKLLQLADRKPAPCTKAGLRYDCQRARAYAAIMTGKPVASHNRFSTRDVTGLCELEHVQGEKQPRVRAVLMADGTWFDVPHWDWAGHLQTVEQCELLA